jgi:hypothetical protein
LDEIIKRRAGDVDLVGLYGSYQRRDCFLRFLQPWVVARRSRGVARQPVEMLVERRGSVPDLGGGVDEYALDILQPDWVIADDGRREIGGLVWAEA